jgi:IS30 family transposase
MKQRTQRKARKLDRVKVLELAQHGMSTTDIAQHQGVAPSTVWRFLQQSEPERQALEQFKTGRADVLARLHAKALDVKERILDTMDDAVIKGMTISQKNGALIALNCVQGTIYDKERLERGESTQNLSVLSKLLRSRVGQIHKRKPLEGQTPIPETGSDSQDKRDPQKPTAVTPDLEQSQ